MLFPAFKQSDQRRTIYALDEGSKFGKDFSLTIICSHQAPPSPFPISHISLPISLAPPSPSPIILTQHLFVESHICWVTIRFILPPGQCPCPSGRSPRRRWETRRCRRRCPPFPWASGPSTGRGSRGPACRASCRGAEVRPPPSWRCWAACSSQRGPPCSSSVAQVL